jgi:hypothetical protein
LHLQIIEINVFVFVFHQNYSDIRKFQLESIVYDYPIPLPLIHLLFINLMS